MSDPLNLDRMRPEWRAVREGWRIERAENPGWTHEYMQRCRTLTRRGPVISATLIGVGGPILTVVAIVGWVL